MLSVIATLASLACATSARAAETITYSYDALGRLIQTSQTGTVNNGAQSTYTYDAADNRTNVTVAPATKTIVVPLNGLTVITAKGS